VSDDPKRLDLIQRYAERLGEAQTNVAEFLAPANSEPLSRGGPKAGLKPDLIVAVPPLHQAAASTARPPRHVEPRKPRDRAGEVHIDLDRLEKLGYIVPSGTKKTQIIEQFQIIKRPVIQKALAAGRGAVRNGNSVMVTSAKPGEGKSFVAANLAMSIASERDLFVMLIDSDIYNPSLPAMLGVTFERGLIDVLLDETMDVAEVLLRTNIPNLTILPAGRRHPRSTELLSSQRMIRLMREVVSRYANRIIIIDSPPVLASTEAGALASHVGQIVMVVEQNRTGWRLVDRSLTRLSECADISFVLNKVEPMWDESFSESYR
jgi:receptor protein-tyrosine kinase